MKRIPEEELMDNPDQARAYADEDYSEPHDAFIAYFSSRFPEFTGGKVLDLGCGPADITIRFALAFPETQITGVDGSASMLSIGEDDIQTRGLVNQISLKKCFLPDHSLSLSQFDAIISNSLLHHLSDPAVLWQAVASCATDRSSIFVMDLLRPACKNDAAKMVKLYASGAPVILKQDFFNSLLAAYTVDEIRDQLSHAGLDHLTVEVVSDRHVIVWGRAE